MTHTSLRAYIDGEEEYPEMKSIGNMTFSNIHVDNTALNRHSAIVMTGLPGNNIRHITLSNITMRMPGGGTERDATTVFREFTKE